MPPSRADAALRRLLHPAYRRLETAVHPLRYLFLEVTQRCNLRCRHCGSDCTRDPQADELSLDEWLAFLDRLRAGFDPRELVLVLTGGEPLCRPRIGELLEGIAARRFTWGMVSNGWGLTEAALGRLAALGLASLTVSLDGLRESHDWLRGVPGSFDRAHAGIRRAVAADLPFLDVVTCVGPRNLGELDGVHELLRAAGVRAWRIFTIFPKGRARDDAELLLSPPELRRLLDWIARRRAEVRDGELRPQLSCEGYLPAALDRAVRDEPYFCRAGISIGSVLCDGSISACPNVSRRLVQGNVRRDDLKTIWEERFQPFRRRDWLASGRCAGCGDFGRCLGNSLHLWDEASGCTALCTRDAARG